MAVSHMFDEFEVHKPSIHPISQDVVLIFEVGEERYVFPMQREPFEKFLELGREALNKRVVLPTGGQDGVGNLQGSASRNPRLA